ncbi:MAG: hypothetical protein VX152_08940, partial [Pseudomonadota bacterium]|nr:hypothetical protein [Pseudomonadota bacterium]
YRRSANAATRAIQRWETLWCRLFVRGTTDARAEAIVSAYLRAGWSSLCVRVLVRLLRYVLGRLRQQQRLIRRRRRQQRQQHSARAKAAAQSATAGAAEAGEGDSDKTNAVQQAYEYVADVFEQLSERLEAVADNLEGGEDGTDA